MSTLKNKFNTILKRVGLKKNYSYYQDYLREINGEARWEISNTEYLNAKKREAKGQPGYLNYLRATKRNNRNKRSYNNWKKTQNVLKAPIQYTENPMMRISPSSSTLASNPVNSRSGSPISEGGRRRRYTRRHR